MIIGKRGVHHHRDDERPNRAPDLSPHFRGSHHHHHDFKWQQQAAALGLNNTNNPSSHPTYNNQNGLTHQNAKHLRASQPHHHHKDEELSLSLSLSRSDSKVRERGGRSCLTGYFYLCGFGMLLLFAYTYREGEGINELHSPSILRRLGSSDVQSLLERLTLETEASAVQSLVKESVVLASAGSDEKGAEGELALLGEEIKESAPAKAASSDQKEPEQSNAPDVSEQSTPATTAPADQKEPGQSGSIEESEQSAPASDEKKTDQSGPLEESEESAPETTVLPEPKEPEQSGSPRGSEQSAPATPAESDKKGPEESSRPPAALPTEESRIVVETTALLQQEKKGRESEQSSADAPTAVPDRKEEGSKQSEQSSKEPAPDKKGPSDGQSATAVSSSPEKKKGEGRSESTASDEEKKSGRGPVQSSATVVITLPVKKEETAVAAPEQSATATAAPPVEKTKSPKDAGKEASGKDTKKEKEASGKDSKKEKKEKEKVQTKFDASKGAWVRDLKPRPVLYDMQCPQLMEAWRCPHFDINERTRYRWRPFGGKLPGFMSPAFLSRMKGKTIVFVGDSMGKQQFQSLSCILSSGFKGAGGQNVTDVTHSYRLRGLTKIARGYLFSPSNITVLHSWTVTLCLEEPMDVNRTEAGVAIHMDRLDSSLVYAAEAGFADLLILNTGHHMSVYQLNRNNWKFHVGGKEIEMPAMADFRATVLRNVARQLETSLRKVAKRRKAWQLTEEGEQRPKVPVIYLRTFSPEHFEKGEWNSGGRCDQFREESKKHQLAVKGLFLGMDTDPIMEQAIKGTSLKVLDITALSVTRPEMHPATDRILRKHNDTTPQDCSHWCLPGIPDTWNDVLFADIFGRNLL